MTGELQCLQVGRTFPSFTLKPLSFQLQKGYLTGLVGVNGAGKTTLINMMAGIDMDYSGQILVDGYDLRTEYAQAKQKIALVSERLVHFMDQTPLEDGELLGEYYENWSMEVFYEWLDRLDIPKGQPLYQLSKGMYMKYQLAFAMACCPDYLLLDEPTAGFDPVFRKEFVRIVQEIRDREIGILMSTHILSDIEYLADYIMLIDGGELREYKSCEETEGKSIYEMLEPCETKHHQTISDLLKKGGEQR